MSALKELEDIRGEEIGQEDEVSPHAYKTMHTFLNAVIDAGLPEPALCPFCGSVIAAWKLNEREVRLQCAPATEKSYIYFRADGVSAIEEASAENLIKRLHWMTSAAIGDLSSSES